ncbi:unnamed protein product, partial [Sphagnum troendelagicum]
MILLMCDCQLLVKTLLYLHLGVDRTSLLLIGAAISIDPTGMLLNSWVNESEVCTGSWMGVECYQGRVFALKLPLSGLFGIIPNNTLGQVTELRVVSLHNNFLTGPFPGELGNCGNLRALYLATNSFFGPLPSLAGFWPRLTHLSLGFNNFSGSIPDSISFFPELYLLDLQNNSFSGSIPPLTLSTLRKLTLQNNNLSGPVPSSLQSFPAADFAGNPDLCGPPTTAPCPVATAPAASPVPAPAPSGSSHRGKRKLAAAYIVAIVVGGSIFLILLATGILLCCWCCWRRAVAAGSGDQKSSSKGEKSSGEKSPDQEHKDDNSSSAQGDQPGGRGSNKLVFFEEAGKRYSFDLEDLLRASAEVLGKGSLGTAYKAVLEDGTIVAVKRLKDVTTPRREFEAQLATVGRLQHPNVVPLRAYYFSKEEKLLVYEYYSNGSLSSYLHGSRSGGQAPLDWVTRARIALGAAKGLAYLHQEAGGGGGASTALKLGSQLAHGNIKSSNILLTQDLEAGVSDFGLVQLVGITASAAAVSSRNLGYCAPEVTETHRLTFMSDVYSFGVVLLELLTGRAPTQTSVNDEGLDLPRWVQSVVREEWTVEVFDVELMRYQNVEEEMVQMLQVAMACVDTVPERRPKMAKVVHMLEDIHQQAGSSLLTPASHLPQIWQKSTKKQQKEKARKISNTRI